MKSLLMTLDHTTLSDAFTYVFLVLRAGPSVERHRLKREKCRATVLIKLMKEFSGL